MSTARAISKLSNRLNPTLWRVRPKDEDLDASYVVMFHLTPESAPSDLVAFIHKEFADEVDRGDTYPHEPDTGTRLSREVFEGYFFVADVLVGIRIDHSSHPDLLPGIDSTSLSETGSKKDCVAGFYYHLTMGSIRILEGWAHTSSGEIEA
ncbi:hypothetical protein ACEPAF_5566 [Sanghuangporus sanghuang]